MAGQLGLFGAERAEADERTAEKGRSARSEPAPAPPDPRALSTILGAETPKKQNPSREGLDSAAEAVGGGDVDSSTPLSLRQALESMRTLIIDQNRWCQGCSARDSRGRPAIPGAQGATTLSAYGAFALLRTRGRIDDATALRLWLELDGATPNGWRFARWHDAPFTTHADVLALLAERVEHAKAERGKQ